DGIRDFHVTGVQTCALPISGQAIAPWDVTSGDREVYSAYIGADFHLTEQLLVDLTGRLEHYSDFGWTITGKLSARYDFSPTFARSEERRVGKECRSRRHPDK